MKILKIFIILILLLPLQCCEKSTDFITPKPIDINNNFQGFGVEWDSRNYLNVGIDDNDFKLITKRLEWMNPPVIRMMMLLKWCYDPNSGFNWHTSEMQYLYKLLDYCQEKSINVILVEWGIEPPWLQIGDLKLVNDQRYSKLVTTYLDYLINTKGYSCIKYFSFVNEPNFEVGDYSRWKEGVLNIYDEIKESNLDKKLRLIGPGTSEDAQWFGKTFDELNDIYNAYDIHKYEYKADITDLKLLNDVLNKTNSISSISNKHFIISEAGMKDGQTTEKNANIDSYDYGVFMANYAIQAVLGGASSVVAWMLDDNSHPNFEWGLWKNKENGMELRPWFYTWSLLTKYFPAGSKIYNIETNSINLRAMAGRIEKLGKTYWTYCIVNLENVSVSLNIIQQNETEENFARYIYQEGKRQIDKNGFPIPADTLTVNLTEGKELKCIPNSVTLLSNYYE